MEVGSWLASRSRLTCRHCWGVASQLADAISISAAFSAIMTVGAAVWPPGIDGITEESITRSPETPFTCRKQAAVAEKQQTNVVEYSRHDPIPTRRAITMRRRSSTSSQDLPGRAFHRPSHEETEHSHHGLFPSPSVPNRRRPSGRRHLPSCMSPR